MLIDGPALRNRRPWAGLSRWSAALGLVASLTASLAAHAGDILRGGAPVGARGGSSRADGPNAAQTAQINANFRDALARTTQAVQSVQALQKSARAIATSGPNNLGMNPNSPGQQLPNVPNGLAIGGLQVAPAVPKNLANPVAGEDPTLWQGATLPAQTTNGGRTVVTIQQTSQQAVLNWQTFNVGKNTTVDFDQSKGGDKQTQWIAFNKILDPSGSPTQILGDIQANGQVYVINRNGIIFGGSSQVNTHGLVASSLSINDTLVANGLLNNPNAQFLFSAATLNGNFVVPGSVIVQPGALLSSPTTPEHVGGRIALIGPTVTNSGTIDTPDGQTIMAAGLQVGFLGSTDSSLRGLNVFVGAETGQTGTVSNFGLIFAERASVVLVGKTVNQMAVIDSTTSVTLNGRIDLLANYNAVVNTGYDPVNRPGNGPFLYQAAGTVTLGSGSVTRILPEYSSTETLASDALPLQSQMNLQGQNIHLASGSALFAPNAAVSLLAGQWVYQGGSIPVSNFTFSSSADRKIQPQIYLDSGALLNVAGTPDVSVPISENILSVELRGNELADSPLQRDGLLRGLTLEVDMRVHGPFDSTLGDFTWVGTPLANAKGYRDLVDRSVGELTTTGGTVTLSSGGSVVLQSGSTVDVSGGSISYQGGMVKTTRLLSQGQIIDISQATPDRVYDGVYTGTYVDAHAKYGISTTFTSPLALSGSHFEASYVQGATGGQITVTAPSMALDGTLLGNTQAGPRQESEGPKPSSLTLNFRAQDNSTASGGPFNFSPTPPTIVFQKENDLSAAAPFTLNALGNAAILSDERQKKVELSPDLLTTSGFGSLSIDNSDGDISVPADVTLAARAGSGQGRSSITLQAASLTIDGHVSAPGGTLAFTVYGATPFYSHLAPVADPVNPLPHVLRQGKGTFTLGEEASLSTAGLIVDQRVDSSDLDPLATTGGSISIASYSANLMPGSTIDVSGGLAISATGKKTFGNAGSISIKAGQDPLVPALSGGTLVLGSELNGFSGAKGGSLAILAPLVQIGGALPATRTVVVNGVPTPRLDFNGTLVDPKAFLYLTPDFFDQGGFTSFSITGLGGTTTANQYLPGVMIAPNTVIEPQPLSLLAESFGGPSGHVQLVPTLLPQFERSPVSLTFQSAGIPVQNATGTNLFAVRGDFVMGAGARIETDPGSSVTIKGDTVAILGSILAPGGTITIAGGSDSNKLFVTNNNRAVATVVLSSNTILSTAGVPVIEVNSRGFRNGTVLDGGTINVSGNIVAQRGAILDVSGATGTVDLPPQDSGLEVSPGVTTPINGLTGSFLGHPLVATQESSSGGAITLSGGQLLFSDATMKGAAGGPGALGGTLDISSGVHADPNVPLTPLDVTLTVQQSGNSIPSSFTAAANSVIGKPLIDLANLGSSGGHISVNDFAGGGFDVLNLHGIVQFKGPVSITVGRELHVADGAANTTLLSGVIFADSTTRLTAPYVALGTAFQTPQTAAQLAQVLSIYTGGGGPFFFAPTFGSGNLIVEASLIDVGNLSLQNIGQASLNARNGDIRGDGFFNMAGRLTLNAGQVYPATAVSFTITTFDYVSGGQTLPGTVNIVASGTPGLPLSAGGTLSIYASTINQAGTLRAPLGQINLGWDGESSSAPPKNLISGTVVGTPVTKAVTLATGSITSVSAVDSNTGVAALLPYGLNLNGSQWIDPTGLDITTGGGPSKSINISGVNIVNQAGSLIDLSGGGDLFAYRFVPGVGGSQDILASTTSFAIIPTYQSGYAPYAPYNSNPTTTNLGSDPGYVNGSLKAGERIYLQGGNGLAAGYYTLLPARYALLPGAYLITPEGSAAVGKYTMPDGSVIMNGAISGQSLLSRYEVASSAVVASRAQYDLYSANTFLAEGAKANNATVPRLPMDAGHLVFQATQSISLLGNVNARGEDGEGKGGLIDIASLSNILIGGPGTTAPSGTLVLDATRLSSFGADSLLIGGVRTLASAGTTVTVKTNNVEVNNAGAPLTGPEIILVANKTLTLDAGAQVIQTGEMQGDADDLTLGNATTVGSGNGLLLRVSSDPGAAITRLGINTAAVPAPLLTIGAGALISGNSIIVDSTGGTSLSPTAILRGEALSLNSGQIILQLDPNATVPASPTTLVLAGQALASLQGAQSLSLLSYGTLDIYGSGTYTAAGTLALHAAAIRGFNNGGGVAEFDAASITLDNKADPTGAGLNPATDTADPGTLRFNAGTFSLGAGQVNIDHYQSVEINTPAEVLITNSGGLHTPGDLTVTTNLVTAAGGTKYSIIAVGDLAFNSTAPAAGAGSGLGATLTLQGASVAMNSTVSLRSGSLTLQATGNTAADGVTIGGLLDVSGTTQQFYDVTQYTDGGLITLGAKSGNIDILATGSLNVSAQAGGGDAGEVSISVPQGSFNLDGQMLGQAGAGGTAGTFSLDVKNFTSFADISPKLLSGGFTEAQSFRVRAGDVTVDNDVRAHTFSLSADLGTITVEGLIDASGATGGTIDLVAGGSVVLASGSTLTVEADDFNNAGKGGAISLEAGSSVNGVAPVGGPRTGSGDFAAGTAVVDIQSGATINLGVKSTYDSSGQANAVKIAAAQSLGHFTGTLHLRAPQTASGTDVQINSIKGSILGSPSNIVVEGYKVYQTDTIDNYEGTVMGDGSTFAGNTTTIKNTLFGAGNPLQSTAIVTPGAEIINLNGDLTLNSDWDLSTYRFGPQNAPGVLTLRAKGNLVFNGALSDGFDVNLQPDVPGFLFLAPLMAYNPNLPINDQSWSYRLTAGADFSAADFHRVRPLSALGANSGSLLLGQPYQAQAADPTNFTLLILLTQNVYQVIRTGSGDIDISTGRDVQLLNPFATIYTAGTILPHDATEIFNPGDFDVPNPEAMNSGNIGLSGSLGGLPFPYTAPQYSLAGGNVTITAQGDIKHQTSTGQPDSELQLPTDWLYRRSDVGSDGKFTTVPQLDSSGIASTTWWVDFTNFFEGVGTLGGGDLTLKAGGNITNVDAVVATNARMVGKDSSGNAVAPNAANLLELGGGDLVVKAGANIDGGVYYVERGNGTLSAGGIITTNSTRAPSGAVASGGAVTSPSTTWLPTTLVLGKGTFDVSANGNILLGPTVNAFLLPQGLLNSPYYRTYFSTFAPDDSVSVTSLGGNVDLRESATTGTTVQPILQLWLDATTVLSSNSASAYQPWIRKGENSVIPFATALSLQPGALHVTAFSGDIDLIGSFNLSPAPEGTLDLFAGGAINGLRPVGSSAAFGILWDTARINVSDANPASIPSITAPLFMIPQDSSQTDTQPSLFVTFNALFAESGSTEGAQSSIETKLALHDSSLLHADDPEPVRLYSLGGNIADFTLYSPKSTRIFAANDVTDVGLYIQNVAADDFSVVAAGNDITAYNPNSPLLQGARQTGNSTIAAALNRDPSQSGDIQISGPGTLEVLAGADLDLGSGRNTGLADDLGVGITSLGNLRNPALPFAGADLIVAAGVGGPSDLSGSSTFDFKTSGDQAASNTTTVSGQNVPLTAEEKAKLAIEAFFVTLRDAGRNHNLATSPDFGTYTAGYDAIAQLFGTSTGKGDIDLSSRSIKTSTGGDINLLAPGGGVNLGFNIPTGNEVPPGIVTEDGGNVNIFADQSVQVGSLRIFTLRGGSEVIWSTNGDIAAGNAAKTVKTAPPTRVVIDSQSADVQTDLAGLATGGGIGVLATVGGVPPGDVDLIAPTGTVDAGDAGIRATGNLTIAAVRVLNADNIQVSGSSSGVPTAPPAASVNLGAITAGNNSAAAGASAATDAAKQARSQGDQEDTPSVITVEVVSFTDEGN